MLQVDNVREVKFRRYRVSLKGPSDSEQGQRCRNSIPEPRQQLMIKTSSPAHTKREIWTEAQCNAEGSNWRKHLHRGHLSYYFSLKIFFHSLFFSWNKEKDFRCINRAGFLSIF